MKKLIFAIVVLFIAGCACEEVREIKAEYSGLSVRVDALQAAVEIIDPNNEELTELNKDIDLYQLHLETLLDAAEVFMCIGEPNE
jgi:hypothetical protein